MDLEPVVLQLHHGAAAVFFSGGPNAPHPVAMVADLIGLGRSRDAFFKGNAPAVGIFGQDLQKALLPSYIQTDPQKCRRRMPGYVPGCIVPYETEGFLFLPCCLLLSLF